MQICDVLFVVAVDIAQAQSQVKILIRTKHSPPNIFNAQATDENIYAGILSVTSDYLFI